MKAPRTNAVYKSHRVLALTFLVILIGLLLAPSGRIKVSVHAQDQQQDQSAASHYYASLDGEQVAELNNLYQGLWVGQSFSEEEKYILRRFAAGAQISELEARVVTARVLYDYYVANNYLSQENLALLKKYEAYCLTEHHFNEDARLKMKRETYARQLATQSKGRRLQPQAVPANDTCAGAIAITDTGSYPITTSTVDAVDATTTGDPTFCPAVSGQDDTIWYTFVPAVTATYSITTCSSVAPGTGSTDTILGVFTSSGACGGPFTSVDCDDDDLTCGSNNNATTISPILTGGVTYYVVAGRSTFLVEPGTVPIQIAISRLPAPANDTCGTATPLTLNTPVTGGTTVAANDDYHLSGSTCFTGWGDNSVGNSTSTATGRDVVYSFTAPAGGTYSFRVTKFGNTLDPVLYLMTSCPGGPAPITITCSNSTGPATVAAHRVNGTGAQEIPCVSLAGGQTVYLVVDEALVSAGSTSFTVEVNPCTEEAEANDNHANDTPATAGIGTEGVISSTTDVDFYLLGMPAAGSRVFALVDGLAANSTDFDMRVTNTTDTLDFDSQDADPQFGSLSPAIGGTLLTGVNSFLRISHGGATSAAGPYRLYTKIQPGGTSDTPNCSGTQSSATAETEPNDTAAQANSAANKYFYGAIPVGTQGDVDYYSFTANTGDLIFLALDGDPCRGSAMNAALDLRDSADALLIGVNDSDGTNCGGSCGPTVGNLAASTPVAPAEALVFRARYTGTYYAKVFTGFPTNATGAGDYLLSISLNNDHGPTAADSTVSGQIIDSNGNPVEGAAVRMSGTQNRLTVTDAAGNYHFDDVEANGFYTVVPTRANFTFSPSQRAFSQLGQHTDAAFNATSTGNALNPLDATEYFVRQQYVDFLGREPDESGLNFWVNNIEGCVDDANCRAVKRIDTSAAFFLSIEFQQTGYLVYRMYQSAYGDMPGAPVPLRLGEFRPDSAEISNGVVVLKSGWEQKLENNKQAFAAEFVQRARFVSAYPATMTPADFVDKLFTNAGVTPGDADRAAAINEFGLASTSSDVASRGRALRRVAENSILAQQEFNQAFVLMEYFGYLQRDPNTRPDTDFSDYNFWLDKLNAFGGNFQNAEMVKAFLVSGEYRGRFPR